MSALRIALLLLVGCAAAPAIPAAPTLASKLREMTAAAPSAAELGWTQVHLTTSRVYDWGQPIYVGVRIVRPPLEPLPPDELRRAAPLAGDELRFIIFGDDGRIVRSTCTEPDAQKVRVALRRGPDAAEAKTVRRLDRCFELLPGRYWIAALYGRYEEAIIRYRVITVSLVVSSCSEVGAVASRCTPEEAGRYLAGLALVGVRSLGAREWDLPLADGEP